MSNGLTDPSTAPTVNRSSSTGDTAQTKQGVADEFWLELVAYGKDKRRSLWLWVDEGWRRLDDPSERIESSVQSAFCNCPNRLKVSVWYRDAVVVGLVVHSQ